MCIVITSLIVFAENFGIVKQINHIRGSLSNFLMRFRLKLGRCKPHKAARHPTKCDVINGVKPFPTLLQILTLSKQMSTYKIKCIRI